MPNKIEILMSIEIILRLPALNVLVVFMVVLPFNLKIFDGF
jgi:hypothetical protein